MPLRFWLTIGCCLAALCCAADVRAQSCTLLEQVAGEIYTDSACDMGGTHDGHIGGYIPCREFIGDTNLPELNLNLVYTEHLGYRVRHLYMGSATTPVVTVTDMGDIKETVIGTANFTVEATLEWLWVESLQRFWYVGGTMEAVFEPGSSSALCGDPNDPDMSSGVEGILVAADDSMEVSASINWDPTSTDCGTVECGHANPCPVYLCAWNQPNWRIPLAAGGPPGALTPPVVNSLGDAADADPADGYCDTGDVTPFADVTECTLRAAIDTINAVSGLDTITYAADDWLGGVDVAYFSESLPAITKPVTIDGDNSSAIDGDPRVIIDGDGGPLGYRTGLNLEAGGTVRNMIVRGFGLDGIRSGGPLVVENVDVLDNCAWGIRSTGPVTVGALDGPLVSIRDNGTRTNCGGGGIAVTEWTDSDAVVARNVEISNNDGAGILAAGRVDVGAVSINGNVGEGIAVVSAGQGGLASVETVRMFGGFAGDFNEILGNQGDGIYAELGHVSLSGPISIDDNFGWGINAAAGLVKLGERDVALSSRNSVNGNGSAAFCSVWEIDNGRPSRALLPCESGGIFSYTDNASEHSDIYQTDIALNGGPGFLAQRGVHLGGVSIVENQGEGVAIVIGDAPWTNTDTAVWMALDFGGQNRIVGNASDGIYAGSGTVTVDARSEISGNAGWGIYAFGGDVSIGAASNDPSLLQQVNGNGVAGQCVVWDIEGMVPTTETRACTGGGVFLDEGDLAGRTIEVRENQGDGVNVTGDVSINVATICRNSGQDLTATGSQDLTDVSFDCDPIPDAGAPTDASLPDIWCIDDAGDAGACPDVSGGVGDDAGGGGGADAGGDGDETGGEGSCGCASAGDVTFTCSLAAFLALLALSRRARQRS